MRSEVEVAVTVLGGVALCDDRGQEIPLAPQKREIVAALAAAAGTNVPRDALLDALWGEDTPATRRRLVSQVNQLRGVLVRGFSIEHRNGGYRLVGPLDLLDATRFESLVSSARELAPAAAAERYAAALRLWRRDTPFANVGNSLVDTAARRLLLLRDEVVLALADAEIAEHRSSLALVHLERLLTDDPARGDVVRRVALLLSIAERDADALRAIERHRRALAQIGAVIAPDLGAMETRILLHEATQTPRAAPSAGPNRTAGWLARRQLLDRVVKTTERGPVLLLGEAGVGKTALTHLLEDHFDATGGPIVVRAEVLPEPRRPMDVVATIAEELRAAFPARMRDALDDPRTLTAVAHIAPGVALRSGSPAAPITRDALLSVLTQLVARVVGDASAVLVIEDAHWLDASSAEVVAGLVRARTRVVITSRLALPTALTTARSDGSLPSIDVPPFDAAEVHQLVHQTLPLRATDDLTAEVLRQTGGNPLFVGLSLDVLARGELGDDVPTSLQRAVDERTSGLSRSAREVLQLAALLGQSFPVGPLRRIRPRALDALRAAEEEGLVRIDSTTASARFVHGLVADALAATVPVGVRPALHDELCRALMDEGHHAMAISVQAHGAVDLDPLRAVETSRDAAGEHAAVFAWSQVALEARRGLDVVERCSMPRTATEAELRWLLGTALRRSNLAGSDEQLLAAAEIAEEVGAATTYAAAVTEACLHGPTSQTGGVDARARAHLDRALALDLDDATRVPLLAAAATLLAFSDESERGRSLYLEAVDRAHEAGDPELERTVAMNAHLGLSHPGDIDRRWHAVGVLGRFDDADAQWEAAFLSVGLGIVSADRPLVDASFERLSALTPDVVQRTRSRGQQQISTVCAFLRGELDVAERLAQDAFATVSATYPESWSTSIYAALLLPIREAQGRLGELWPVIEAIVRRSPEWLTWHAVAASAACALGDLESMAAAVAVLRDHELRFVPDLTWTAAATITARPIRASGDPVLARQAYDQLLPCSGQMSWNGLSTHGAVDAALALLADAFGDRHRMRAHVRLARRLVDRLGAPHLWWPELDELDVLDR